MKSIINALLVSLFFAGCTQGGSPVQTLTLPEHDAKTAYYGTSATDLWSSNPLQHWNGSSWTKITLPNPISQGIGLAGPNKIWVAGTHSLWRIDGSGTVEDFSAELVAKITPTPTGWFPTFTSGHGHVLIVVKGINTENKTQAFTFDGTHLREIPIPPNGALSGAVVYGDDDIFGVSDGSFVTPFDEQSRDVASGMVHFDGTSWTAGTLGGEAQVILTPAATVFPKNDVWLNCGPNAKHFDGSITRPLGVPLPVTTNCVFGYQHGRPSIIFGAQSDPGTTPTAYSCDTGGNCSLLDVAGYVSSEFQRLEWDGRKWTGGQIVARVEQCVGPACGYGAGTNVGVVGQLDDGTQLFLGKPKADLNAESGPETLYLVGP